MRHYIVIEQWPYREVVCFTVLQDAVDYFRTCGLALPLIVVQN